MQVEQWRAERRRRFPTAITVCERQEREAALAAAGGLLQGSEGSLKRQRDVETATAGGGGADSIGGGSGSGSGKDSAGRRPCFQFAKGRCNKARCRFSHGDAARAEAVAGTGAGAASKQRGGNSKLHLPAPLAGGSRGTLLKALLGEQARREENLLLQSLRYIASNLFPMDA